LKRGDYIRLTVHPKPWGLNAPLSVLTLISEHVSVIEGWLTARPGATSTWEKHSPGEAESLGQLVVATKSRKARAFSGT